MLLAFEPEGSSGIVYTLLHTEIHTTVSNSGIIFINAVSIVDIRAAAATIVLGICIGISDEPLD